MLPTNYSANKKARMTSELFEKQLHCLGAKMGTHNRKILLLVDCSHVHPRKIRLRNVQSVLLPPNCTSKLQPLDLGIIHAFKTDYRKAIVLKESSLMEVGKDSASFRVSILDALRYIVMAWTEVTAATISNCFRKVGFIEADDRNRSDAPDVSISDNGEKLLASSWEKLQLQASGSRFLTR
ncbi:tigger transposable element-derived protein 6-like [Schistocerca piceifrons]|uniref:tigger transposable element-derived protein 6-like n=1 Tax=Schistocerca piceifrons TaxID=274613 RepID=UPI001F5F0389|nr:tigger transposable element-derived protein 6-like [Schistocerca piceifrons]